MPAKRNATKKTTTSTTKASKKLNETLQEAGESADKASEKMETIKKVVECAPAPALNVRKSPSKDSEVVDEYPHGTEIDCVEASEGWFKTEDGYVMADFLV